MSIDSFPSDASLSTLEGELLVLERAEIRELWIWKITKEIINRLKKTQSLTAKAKADLLNELISEAQNKESEILEKLSHLIPEHEECWFIHIDVLNRGEVWVDTDFFQTVLEYFALRNGSADITRLREIFSSSENHGKYSFVLEIGRKSMDNSPCIRNMSLKEPAQKSHTQKQNNWMETYTWDIENPNA